MGQWFRKKCSEPQPHTHIDTNHNTHNHTIVPNYIHTCAHTWKNTLDSVTHIITNIAHINQTPWHGEHMCVCVCVCVRLALLKFYDETWRLNLMQTIWQNQCLISTCSSLRHRGAYGVCVVTCSLYTCDELMASNTHTHTHTGAKRKSVCNWEGESNASENICFSKVLCNYQSSDICLQLNWSHRNKDWLKGLLCCWYTLNLTHMKCFIISPWKFCIVALVITLAFIFVHVNFLLSYS